MTVANTDEPTDVSETDVDVQAVRNLTAFQRNILAVLADEPTYGLAIKSELEDYYGEEVNHGRLYPNLDELVEIGLVEKGQIDKRTNEYALTEAGRAAVHDQIGWVVSKLTESEAADEIEDLIEN